MIVALFGLLMPRFIMVLLWLFSDYLSEAFGTWVWPLIGFFILPTTTLCYAVAVQELDGFTGWGAALTILGLLAPPQRHSRPGTRESAALHAPHGEG